MRKLIEMSCINLSKWKAIHLLFVCAVRLISCINLSKWKAIHLDVCIDLTYNLLKGLWE